MLTEDMMRFELVKQLLAQGIEISDAISIAAKAMQFIIHGTRDA